MTCDLICHQNKANNESKYRVRSCKPPTPWGPRECVYRPRVCVQALTYTRSIEAAAHWQPALLFSWVRKGVLRHIKITLFLWLCAKLPLVAVCTSSCVWWLLWCPPHWSQTSCWVRAACLLQTDPYRLYLQVNIAKENSKGCVGFCWSFMTKNGHMELENRWVSYSTKNNLSLMKGFIDLQKYLAWSWFPFYRWGSCDRERRIHLSKVTQQVYDNTRKQIQIV